MQADFAARPASPPRLRAAVLSALVPGAGQLYRRRWVRGALLLASTAALVVGGVWMAERGALAWLRLVVRPDGLLVLGLANLAVAAVRVFAVVDAYRTEAPSPTWHRAVLRAVGRVTVLTVILTAVAAPHVLLTGYLVDVNGALAAAFVDEPRPLLPPQPTVTLTAVRESPSPSPTDAATPTAEAAAPTAEPPPAPPSPLPPGPSPRAEPSTLDQPEHGLFAQLPDGRLDVLLVGTDAGPGRSGARTDTMLVVSTDVVTGHTALFGIPRNLVNVPLPPQFSVPWECRCYPDLLNSLVVYARAHPEQFPGGRDPGETALAGAVGELLGRTIDHQAVVDMAGFVAAVDALGGVTVDIAVALHDRLSPAHEGEPWTELDLPPGRHHLDGRLALAYARSRTGTTDYVRMARQRCLLVAAAREADFLTLFTGLPRLTDAIESSVRTDIPRWALPELIDLATRAGRAPTVTVGFTPPDYVAGWVGTQPVPDADAVRAAVDAATRGETPPAPDGPQDC